MIRFRELFLFSLILFLTGLAARADLLVPPVVVLHFNQGDTGNQYYNANLPDSVFSTGSSINTLIQDTDVPSQDYRIYGTIYTNCPDANCDNTGTFSLEIASSQITMSNSLSNIEVNFTGTLNGQAISFGSTNGITVVADTIVPSLGFRSDIVLIGDVDESTVEILDKAGEYSGTITVNITIQ